MMKAGACTVALIATLAGAGPALAQVVVTPGAETRASEAAQDGPQVQVGSELLGQMAEAFAGVATNPGTGLELAVGTVLPHDVTLRPLPAAVVRLVPAYAGYLFLATPDGRVAIVAPATLEIVLVLRTARQAVDQG
jgi:hypothetical protein